MTKKLGNGTAAAFPRSRRPSKCIIVVFGLGFLLLLFITKRSSLARDLPMPVLSDIQLPNDLEAVVLSQFDTLVEKREIFYEESEVETVENDGLQFQFRIVSFLDQKPISAPDAPDRVKAGGPFENPRPEEIIAMVGPYHRLMLNKYCIYRPMLVLSTKEYAPQTDDLDESDISAAWAVLQAFASPQMVIYNCGANAGSSIGHKHLQMFPLPSVKDGILFPAHATSTRTIESRIENVPFKHYVLRIPFGSTGSTVFEQYQSLLEVTRDALREGNAGNDYNVVFTAEWIVLIPRRTAVWGGPFGANAAGMVGMVTVPNKQQRDQWEELGYTKYLIRLGIPLE